MPRNTLYDLVNILSKPELDELTAYLANPYNGAKKHHVQCFAAIKKNIKNKQILERLTKEKLFACSFGKLPYSDVKLRNLKSETCRLIEDFLAVKQLRSSTMWRSELLAAALEERKDYHLFKETIAKRLKTLERQDEKGKSYFWELASLYRLLYYHPEAERLDRDNDFLQRHIENLEHFFILSCLESGTESLLKRAVINFEEQSSFLKTAAIVAEKKRTLFPVMAAYFSLYQLYADSEVALDLNLVKKQVFNFLKHMEVWERKMALKLLTQKANANKQIGRKQRDKLLFDLYKKSVEEGFSKAPNGIIEPNHFINIVIVAAKAQEYDWAFIFLEQKLRYLPKTEKKLVEKICLGSIYFQKGLSKKNKTDLKKALGFLEPVPPRCHEKYNLRIRSLTVRIYYELLHEKGDFDKIENQVRNFEEYLNNNSTLSENKKSDYHIFLNKFKALCELHLFPNNTRLNIDQYLKELSENDNIFLREWLLEKAEGLKKSLRF